MKTSPILGQSPTLDNQPQTNRNRLLDAIDGFVGGVALYDHNGALIVANQCYESFFPELDGMQVGDLFADQLQQRLAAHAIPHAIGHEEKWLKERLDCFFDPNPTSRDVLYPDGRWIRATEQGVSDGILRTLFDVTAHQNLTLRLNANAQRFKDFSNCAADVFWETDANLNYIYLTGDVTELLGMRASAFIGEPLILLSPDAVISNYPATARTQTAPWFQQQKFQKTKLGLLMADASHRVLVCSGVPVFNAENIFSGYRGTLTDVTETDEPRLTTHLNLHDELTNLPGRRAFDARLQLALSETRSSDTVHTLCYFDLDRFRDLVNAAGQDAGDNVLKQVADVLTQNTRQSDSLARLGNDVFGLLLRNSSLSRSQIMVRKICDTISALRVRNVHDTYQISTSVGLAEISRNTANTTEALTNADLACHSAKAQDNQRIFPYRSDEDVLLRNLAESKQITEIKSTLIQPRQMRLYFQPIVASAPTDERPAHYELLLRLFDDKGKMSLPRLFIATAERHQLMGYVDRWVIEHAFRTLARTSRDHPELKFSINVSEQSLSDSEFGGHICSQVNSSGCDPAKICFEITETTTIKNLRTTLHFMDRMREFGFRFALDNFGSDYSSITQLKRLPVDYLKIDAKLIKNIRHQAADKTIVKSICNICKSLNIAVIAEFAEDTMTVDLLSVLGVDYIQGFQTGRPGAKMLS